MDPRIEYLFKEAAHYQTLMDGEQNDRMNSMIQITQERIINQNKYWEHSLNLAFSMTFSIGIFEQAEEKDRVDANLAIFREIGFSDLFVSLFADRFLLMAVPEVLSIIESVWRSCQYFPSFKDCISFIERVVFSGFDILDVGIAKSPNITDIIDDFYKQEKA